MVPRRITLAFATLFAAAPLLGASAYAQTSAPERAQATERAQTTQPPESTQLYRPNETAPVPNVEPSVPRTPVPMDLPDRVGSNEIEGEYGVGMASLIIGVVLVAALVSLVFVFISRRSWSAQH